MSPPVGAARGRLASLPPPPAHLARHFVQVRQQSPGARRPPPADDSELGHALVGRDDDLHTGPTSVHQPLARPWATSPTGAEDGFVVFRRDGPLQPEPRPARAAPDRASHPGTRSTPSPSRGGHRPARAPSPGGTRPTRLPSSASSPRPTSTTENATEFLRQALACNRVLLLVLFY